MVLLPNDRYPLDREVFRLYYTSACEEQQTIDIYFEDNSELEQLFLLSFDFNNEKKDEPGEEIEDPVVGSETPWVRDSLVIVRPPVSKSEKVSVCSDYNGYISDFDLLWHGGSSTGRRFVASRR